MDDLQCPSMVTDAWLTRCITIRIVIYSISWLGKANFEAPSPLDVPVGCPFQNRCEHCTEKCKKEMPKLKEIAPGHEVACFYVESMQNQAEGGR